MRIRSIKPEFWTDALMGEMDARRALFFVGLWQVADDAGRLRLDPRLVRADLDPFDAKFGGLKGVGALLNEFVGLGRLVPYEVGGQQYALIANFKRHQKINKPTESRIPAPPQGAMAPVGLPEDSGRASVGLPAGREQGAGSEEQGGEQGGAEAPPPPPRDGDDRRSRYPRTAALLDALEAAGTAGAWASKPETRALVETAIGAQDVAEVAARVGPAIVETGKAWLGHHTDLIRRAARPARPTFGDLQVELDEWWRRVTPERRAVYCSDRRAIDPGLDDGAPLAATGTVDPAAVAALMAELRAEVTPGRPGVAA